MSHRVTVDTEIKDREHAITALKDAKIEYREQGDTLYLLSGDYRDTTINLRTGKIVSGDTDHVRVDSGKLGLLRQQYTEAKYRAECFEQGIQIHDRTVIDHNGVRGVIRLQCRMA